MAVKLAKEKEQEIEREKDIFDTCHRKQYISLFGFSFLKLSSLTKHPLASACGGLARNSALHVELMKQRKQNVFKWTRGVKRWKEDIVFENNRVWQGRNKKENFFKKKRPSGRRSAPTLWLTPLLSLYPLYIYRHTQPIMEYTKWVDGRDRDGQDGGEGIERKVKRMAEPTDKRALHLRE